MLAEGNSNGRRSRVPFSSQNLGRSLFVHTDVHNCACWSNQVITQRGLSVLITVCLQEFNKMVVKNWLYKNKEMGKDFIALWTLSAVFIQCEIAAFRQFSQLPWDLLFPAPDFSLLHTTPPWDGTGFMQLRGECGQGITPQPFCFLCWGIWLSDFKYLPQKGGKGLWRQRGAGWLVLAAVPVESIHQTPFPASQVQP